MFFEISRNPIFFLNRFRYTENDTENINVQPKTHQRHKHTLRFLFFLFSKIHIFKKYKFEKLAFYVDLYDIIYILCLGPHSLTSSKLPKLQIWAATSFALIAPFSVVTEASSLSSVLFDCFMTRSVIGPKSAPDDVESSFFWGKPIGGGKERVWTGGRINILPPKLVGPYGPQHKMEIMPYEPT